VSHIGHKTVRQLLMPAASSKGIMKPKEQRKPVFRIHQFVESLCGMYSRVARRLKMSPSFVSRVARGERQSPAVEQAIVEEFRDVGTELLGEAPQL
jgi:hypothetical protein